MHASAVSAQGNVTAQAGVWPVFNMKIGHRAPDSQPAKDTREYELKPRWLMNGE